MMKEINKIAEKLSKNKKVEAIILFGSYAREEENSLSDIDVCVVGRNLSREDITSCSDLLDISLFERLPLAVKFRALKEGKVLFERNEGFIDMLKVETAKRYLDFKFVINKYCEEVLGCTI